MQKTSNISVSSTFKLNARRSALLFGALFAIAVLTSSPTPVGAAPITVTGPDGKAYTVIDPDKDGWGELWCMLNGIKHRDRTIDSDGDGLTDYEEMVMGTDPWRKNPLPRDPTFAEIAEYQRNAAAMRAAAQKEWEAKLAEAAPRIVELIPPGKSVSEAKEKAATAEVAALRQQAEQSRLEQPAKEQELDEIARRLGVAREIIWADGRKSRLAGEIGGSPVWTGSHIFVAGMSISADDLWPTNIAPFSTNNLLLNLTGQGQTLALWENDGGVRTTHVDFEFGARATQKDGSAIDTGGHATAVAGMMAGGGNYVFGGSGYPLARGVANQATVFAYDLATFKMEREAAAAGTTNDPPIFISNQSWGLLSGWRRELASSGTNQFLVWVWYGFTNCAVVEDFEFGSYRPDLPGDVGCTQIDLFLQSQAPWHLMVFSCGNDRLEGPGGSTNYYVPGPSNTLILMTCARNWADGDAGGFDSISAPGTAKNVLTVGACEDVYSISGGVTNFGYIPGANAVAAPFSGAGPTDDGRIKPDLVAVGLSNATLRAALAPLTGDVPYGLLMAEDDHDYHYTTGRAGTSFAAPAVTGGLGLMQQRYAQLYGTLSVSNSWCNSTLKAIAIDTADDVGAPGPDYRFGYGIFNARSSVLRVNNDYNFGRGSLIKEFTLVPSNSVSWVVVSDGASPLCVTAAWSDPPGPATTSTNVDPVTPMLVNNLNLSVQNLDSGTNYFPWILNADLTNKSATVRSNAATRGVDSRNNVEQVSITNPPAGRYLVIVTHSGGLSGNPAPTNQLVSITVGGTFPEMATVTSLAQSPGSNQTLLTFTADPGAYFKVETSTNFTAWTNVGSLLAATVTNSVLVTNAPGEQYRFWRLRRGQ